MKGFYLADIKKGGKINDHPPFFHAKKP